MRHLRGFKTPVGVLCKYVKCMQELMSTVPQLTLLVMCVGRAIDTNSVQEATADLRQDTLRTQLLRPFTR